MSKATVERNQAIAAKLAARYPKAFSLNPIGVRPLKHGIFSDIIADLQPQGIEVRHLRTAFLYYVHSPAYLMAVALGKQRRDLRGWRMGITGATDRQNARAELQKRGAWTENLEHRYRGHLDGLDTSPLRV